MPTRWTQQRTAIVSLFLLCAGCGQAMALDAGWGWARFARRWGYIVAAAALVTLGSWWMFPQSFIYFGVLHGMAVMLVFVRLLAGVGNICGGWVPSCWRYRGWRRPATRPLGCCGTLV